MSLIDTHNGEPLDYKHILEQVRDYPHLLGHMMGRTKLTEMHSQWCWDLWGEPDGEHTANQAHRGAFKTTILTEVGCIWWLLFHPNDRIALIRETWTVANDTLKTIAQLFQIEAVQALFKYAHGEVPKFRTKKDGKLVMSFKTTITKEGSIDSYGISQVPTGSHYDRILCDDIITINDRFSKAKREATKNGVREIMTNIIDPGKSVHFVGTPWDKDDAWEMENEAGEKIIPEPKKYTCYDTGLLTEEEIQAKRDTTSKLLFGANYELVHHPADDQMFKDPQFGDWDGTLHKSRYVGHIDAAYGGDCLNAMTIMARRLDGKIQVTGKCLIGDIKDHYPEVYSFFHKNKATKVYSEDNADKGFLNRDLKVKRKGIALNAISYHETMNKHVKIVSYLKKYWKDLVFDHDCDPVYLSVIQDYMEGMEPNDSADSAASLLREFFYPKDPDSHKSALYNFDD